MTKEKLHYGHIGLALLPLALTPALVFLLAEGLIDFGGGEKDLILAIPYVLWTAIFAVSSVVLILKRWTLRRWLKRSFLISVAAIMLVWLIALLMNWLGVM